MSRITALQELLSDQFNVYMYLQLMIDLQILKKAFNTLGKYD